MSLAEVKETIIESKLMCIFRVSEIDKEVIAKAALACIDGGARLIEIAYNHQGYEEKTPEVFRAVKEAAGGRAYVGIGTIMNLHEAKIALEEGADFIVAPTFDPEVSDYAQKQGVYYMPGAFTANEIVEAYRHGHDLVKLLPTGEIGLDYAKALMKIMGYIRFFAVGKMTLDFYAECLDAGFSAAGISSAINNREILERQDYALIERLVRQYVEIAAKNKAQAAL